MAEQFRVVSTAEVGQNREIAISLKDGKIHMAERNVTETDEGTRHSYQKNGFVFRMEGLPKLLIAVQAAIERLGIPSPVPYNEAPATSALISELPDQNA